MTGFIRDYGLIIVFLLIALETSGLPLPGETALVAAGGARVARPLLDRGGDRRRDAAAIIGDNIGYWLGRKLGRGFLQRYGVVRRFSDRVLPPTERFFRRHGGKAIFLARWFSGFRIAGAWIAGFAHMPWWRFFVWNAAGGIAWAVTVALVAYYAGHAAADAISRYGLIGAGVIVVLVLLARRRAPSLAPPGRRGVLRWPRHGYESPVGGREGGRCRGDRDSRGRAGVALSATSTPRGGAFAIREVIERLDALAIPPAWKEVWISASARSKLQATGVDAAGRKQYRYHEAFRAKQEEAKYEKLIRFAERLPDLRLALGEHMTRDPLDELRVCAVAVRLINLAWFRVGSDRHTKRSRTFGVTTLRKSHVERPRNEGALHLSRRRAGCRCARRSSTWSSQRRSGSC